MRKLIMVLVDIVALFVALVLIVLDRAISRKDIILDYLTRKRK